MNLTDMGRRTDLESRHVAGYTFIVSDERQRPHDDGVGRRLAIGCSLVAALAILSFWLLRGVLIG